MQKHSMKDCGFIRQSRAKSHELRSLRLLFVLGVSAVLVLELSSCSDGRPRVVASAPGVTVGVTTIERRDLTREITLSSELVPSKRSTYTPRKPVM